MKVSVIIPFYNLEDYVDRCMESVTGQSHTDLEIIAVDNCSADRTADKLAEWKEKDARITVINMPENAGPSGARNAALDIARGEYICFVDGDDCVSPMYVQHLLQYAQDTGCWLAMCGYSVNDTITNPADIPATMQMYYPEVIDQRDYFLRLYTDKEILYVVRWNKIYHRSLLRQLRYADMLNEDEEIIHRIVSQVDKVAVCYEPLYFYTVRPGSIMNRGFSPDYLDIFAALQDRMDYFAEQGWQDLAFMTMKKYMVHCLVMYNRIDKDTPNGKDYKVHLKRMLSMMYSQALSCPAASKKFMLKMKYYQMFPSKLAPGGENALFTT